MLLTHCEQTSVPPESFVLDDWLKEEMINEPDADQKMVSGGPANEEVDAISRPTPLNAGEGLSNAFLNLVRLHVT